jgi:hypothetical protein
MTNVISCLCQRRANYFIKMIIITTIIANNNIICLHHGVKRKRKQRLDRIILKFRQSSREPKDQGTSGDV